MRGLSEKIAGIPPSATIEISNAAKRMAQEGIDVISLSIGEPDFDTPLRHPFCRVRYLDGCGGRDARNLL